MVFMIEYALIVIFAIYLVIWCIKQKLEIIFVPIMVLYAVIFAISIIGDAVIAKHFPNCDGYISLGVSILYILFWVRLMVKRNRDEKENEGVLF